MLKLDTVFTLGKSLTAKAVKGEGGAEFVTCEVKFSGMFVQRDHVDELLGMPFGWAAIAVYDEQGDPLARLSISSHRSSLRATGRIAGPRDNPSLAILQADLSDVELALMNLGAIASGKLTWKARGDEVEDVSELLGKLCIAQFDVTDGNQADLFDSQRKRMEAAGQNAMAMLDRIAAFRSQSNGSADPGSPS